MGIERVETEYAGHIHASTPRTRAASEGDSPHSFFRITKPISSFFLLPDG